MTPRIDAWIGVAAAALILMRRGPERVERERRPRRRRRYAARLDREAVARRQKEADR